jgi:hypothetical protein
VEALTNELRLPDLNAPDLNAPNLLSDGERLRTPSPNLESSSVENTPLKSIEALTKDQAKVLKHIDNLASKAQRNLQKIFNNQLRT